jgi:hypothetical protein
MEKTYFFLTFMLMFLFPINSIGQLKGTSRNRLISWTQSVDGTLTFVGSGILDGREFSGFSDDFKVCNRRIVISSGITEVRYLHDMCQVEHVSLPNTLKKIGTFAFRGYSELKSITIPASVIEIAQCAFDMREWGGGKLERIIVDKGNAQFKSINGILYDHDVKTLICCPSGYNGEVNIPNTVETIEEMAFSFCNNLRNVKLPEKLTIIKDSAFMYSNIRYLNMPQSVSCIGKDVFKGCRELKRVYVGNKNLNINNVIPKNIIFINPIK